jgi:5'-3' exonuclease
MTPPNTLHLIDASYFIFRAYYAFPEPMTDPHGRSVNAVFGFARFLTEYIERHRPTHCVVAFDDGLEENFRTEIYPAYKANREPPPDDLSEQFERCMLLCEPLGLKAIRVPGYEADDIIGTLAERFRPFNVHNCIVTRDKDLSQLIRENDVFFDYTDNKRYHYKDIPERFGVIPERMAEYLALTGDSVDNIPGVPGVGPKTASALMRHFQSLEDLYARLNEVAGLDIRGAKTLGPKLAEHQKAAFQARELTRILCEVPLDCTWQEAQRQAVQFERLEALYDEAGFGPTLRNRAKNLGRN